MDDLTFPLDQSVIQQVLPHRFPFLFVDRIVAFETDRRIVGIKNVSGGEALLSPDRDGVRVLPVALLTEAMAQVGAILVLLKPENRGRLVFFMGIDHARFRRPVHPGETVEIEAVVQKLRDRMGRFAGTARVNGHLVAHGRMTFALGPRHGR
jgi:3-hydroxyacyl-[acyl-carrier-protein] dehydratase